MKISNLLSLLLVPLTLNSWASCIKNVPMAFENLKWRPTPLTVRTNSLFKGRMYTQALVNGFGLDNHFQGMIRVPGTTQFILSGGDIYRKIGHLFMFDIASQDGKEIFDQNFVKRRAQTPMEDKFIWRMEVGNSLEWHPGGLSILDNIISVPIEDYKINNTAEVIFLDVNDPYAPKILPVSIIRKHNDAGNSSMFYDKEGHLVVGVYTGGEMEFYRTRTKNILDGFEEETKIIKSEAGGSSTQVLKQCDGRLFVVDFFNEGKTPPIVNGLDVANIYDFTYPDLSIKKRSTKRFKTTGNCNFSAAATTYVTPQGELVLYGSQYFRNWVGNRLKICQISSR